MCTHRTSRFVALLFVTALPFLCRAEDPYKSVETADLLKTPQKYWARPIVFKDTLVELPKNARVEIENKRYAEFSTRNVGACYASVDLLPAMSNLAVNSEYLFSGTVFQHRGRYVPVIQSCTPAIDSQKLSKELRAVAEETPESVTNESVRSMAAVMAAVQSAQLAYAKEKNIPLCQLYDPASEHFIKAMDIARTAIYNSEQKHNTASAEILAQYLTTIIAKQCATGAVTQTAPAVETPPAPQPAPPPAMLAQGPLAAPQTNTAPPKLSWSERRALARAEKEAARREKEKLEAEKAAEEAARKAAAAVPIPPPQTPEQVAAGPETQPPTHAIQPTATPPAEPATPSWFQRWKLEREKEAALKAEAERIEK